MSDAPEDQLYDIMAFATARRWESSSCSTTSHVTQRPTHAITMKHGQPPAHIIIWPIHTRIPYYHCIASNNLKRFICWSKHRDLSHNARLTMHVHHDIYPVKFPWGKKVGLTNPTQFISPMQMHIWTMQQTHGQPHWFTLHNSNRTYDTVWRGTVTCPLS